MEKVSGLHFKFLFLEVVKPSRCFEVCATALKQLTTHAHTCINVTSDLDRAEYNPLNNIIRNTKPILFKSRT